MIMNITVSSMDIIPIAETPRGFCLRRLLIYPFTFAGPGYPRGWQVCWHHLRSYPRSNTDTMNSQTNPIAWENLPHHWNLELFYTLVITFDLIFIYFVYVETRGPTL